MGLFVPKGNTTAHEMEKKKKHLLIQKERKKRL